MLKRPFLVNDVLQDGGDGLIRLLTFDVDSNDAWLIRLKDEVALPYKTSYADLPTWATHAPSENKALPAKSSAQTVGMVALATAPTKSSLELCDRAWPRIAPLVDNPGIFDPKTRSELLKKRAAEPGDPGTPKTLLKHLRAYWQGGQTQDALLGNYAKCGRPDVKGTGGRGRKTRKGSDAYQLGEKDEQAMKHVIEEFYFKNPCRTLTKTLQELHERHYAYLDGNGDKCLLPESECPSYRQLSYFLASRYSTEQRVVGRLGQKDFERNHRSTEGSIQLDCHGIGHIYEFDATIVDVPLVSAADPGAIVGKPTMYLIIDRASRLIVGWYLGFENACYSAAMQAILSLGEDKEQLCIRYGVAYDDADWPAHGILPEMFLADQGELVSKDGRQIARSMRVTLSNVPGLRPDWKPLVEVGFSMIHQILAPGTPGYTPDADNRKRRATKHDRNAALNLEQFTSIIIKAIITHNKTMQKAFPLSHHQIENGTPPIPRELWVDGIRSRMGKLSQIDFEKVRADLLPRDKGVITSSGILFRGCYYDCPEAAQGGWLVDGRKQRRPVDIAFDYRLANEIVVSAPDRSGQSFVAALTKDSVMFKGMAFADIARHFAAVKLLTEPAAALKRQNTFEFNQHAGAISAAATVAMKQTSKGRSRSSRKVDTAPQRAIELALERQKTAGVGFVPVTTTQAPPGGPPPSRTADVIQLRPSTPATPAVSVAVKTPEAPLTLKQRMSDASRKLRASLPNPAPRNTQ